MCVEQQSTYLFYSNLTPFKVASIPPLHKTTRDGSSCQIQCTLSCPHFESWQRIHPFSGFSIQNASSDSCCSVIFMGFFLGLLFKFCANHILLGYLKSLIYIFPGRTLLLNRVLFLQCLFLPSTQPREGGIGSHSSLCLLIHSLINRLCPIIFAYPLLQ